MLVKGNYYSVSSFVHESGYLTEVSYPYSWQQDPFFPSNTDETGSWMDFKRGAAGESEHLSEAVTTLPKGLSCTRRT